MLVVPAAPPTQPAARWRVDLIQSGQIGTADPADRRPRTRLLADRSAILAGALGGVITTKLANAGLGHLHLIDGDIVDPATFCRQVGALQLAGLPKANAIAAELALHSPHSTVTAGSSSGSVPGGSQPACCCDAAFPLVDT